MAERIKAIPTVYNDIQFKSRTEARWAVFFDALDLEYQYEPRSFLVGDYGYLPDFYMGCLPGWIEVKGPTPTPEEYAKGRAVADITGENFYFLVGAPRFGKRQGQASVLLSDPSSLKGHLQEMITGDVKRTAILLRKVYTEGFSPSAIIPSNPGKIEDIRCIVRSARSLWRWLIKEIPGWLLSRNNLVKIDNLHWRHDTEGGYDLGEDIFLDLYRIVSRYESSSFRTGRLLRAYDAAWNASWGT